MDDTLRACQPLGIESEDGFVVRDPLSSDVDAGDTDTQITSASCFIHLSSLSLCYGCVVRLQCLLYLLRLLCLYDWAGRVVHHSTAAPLCLSIDVFNAYCIDLLSSSPLLSYLMI